MQFGIFLLESAKKHSVKTIFNFNFKKKLALAVLLVKHEKNAENRINGWRYGLLRPDSQAVHAQTSALYCLYC